MPDKRLEMRTESTEIPAATLWIKPHILTVKSGDYHLKHTSGSPGGLVETQVVGPHPRGFDSVFLDRNPGL